jgi:hypothetical protein
VGSRAAVVFQVTGHGLHVSTGRKDGAAEGRRTLWARTYKPSRPARTTRKATACARAENIPLRRDIEVEEALWKGRGDVSREERSPDS